MGKWPISAHEKETKLSGSKAIRMLRTRDKKNTRKLFACKRSIKEECVLLITPLPQTQLPRRVAVGQSHPHPTLLFRPSPNHPLSFPSPLSTPTMWSAVSTCSTLSNLREQFRAARRILDDSNLPSIWCAAFCAH